MRATVAEFADPDFERPIRTLNTEIVNDPELATQFREKLAHPVDEAEKTRLRSAQRAGQLAPDAHLDLSLGVFDSLEQRLLGNGSDRGARVPAPCP